MIRFDGDIHLLYQASDNLLGRFTFEGVSSYAVDANKITENLKEVTSAEYDKVVHEFIDELLNTDWSKYYEYCDSDGVRYE